MIYNPQIPTELTQKTKFQKVFRCLFHIRSRPQDGLSNPLLPQRRFDYTNNRLGQGRVDKPLQRESNNSVPVEVVSSNIGGSHFQLYRSSRLSFRPQSTTHWITTLSMWQCKHHKIINLRPMIRSVCLPFPNVSHTQQSSVLVTSGTLVVEQYTWVRLCVYVFV